MPVCSFCKQQYEFPRGTTVVQKDTSVRYYCSSKCKKNMEMGRQNKKVKWIIKSDIAKEEKKKKEEFKKQKREAAEATKQAKKQRKTKKKK